MGLYPSFPAFALSHHRLLTDIEEELGVKDTYRILGDDIVISDGDVHESYRSKLNDLACPVSESKCLISNKFAEFAGKLVTGDSEFPTFKHRHVSSRNFLDIVRSLGRQAIGLLDNEQKRVLMYLAALPEPWGLGWNSSGATLESRIRGREYLFTDNFEGVSMRFSKTCELDDDISHRKVDPKSYFEYIEWAEQQEERTNYTFQASCVPIRDEPTVQDRTPEPTRFRAAYEWIGILERNFPGTNAGLFSRLMELAEEEDERTSVMKKARSYGYFAEAPDKGDPRPDLVTYYNEIIDEQVSVNRDLGVTPEVVNRFEKKREKEEERRWNTPQKGGHSPNRKRPVSRKPIVPPEKGGGGFEID